MTNTKRFPADEAIHHTGQRGPMVVLASDHDAETDRLQRHLDSRNEQIDGYERQLGIDEVGAEHTIGSEIERLTKERAEYKIWWERDSTALGAALNEVSSLRAGKEQFRAQVQQLRAALKVARQALIETIHAQDVGPSWYTRGESGMYAQVRMWTRRGTEAIAAALGPYDENGEYEKEKASHEPVQYPAPGEDHPDLRKVSDSVKPLEGKLTPEPCEQLPEGLRDPLKVMERVRELQNRCRSGLGYQGEFLSETQCTLKEGHSGPHNYASDPRGASRDASPADLVGALQDVVHTHPGPVRAGKAHRDASSDDRVSIECPECFGNKRISMSDGSSRRCEYCSGTGRAILKLEAGQ